MQQKRHTRRRTTLNLAPDVISALVEKALEVDIPMSRIVDAAVRDALGLKKPQEESTAPSAYACRRDARRRAA